MKNKISNYSKKILSLFMAVFFVTFVAADIKSSAVNLDTTNSKLLRIGDFDNDGTIGTIDLTKLLSSWGSSDPLYDENGDGVVGSEDLAMLLANWGKGNMLRADIVHLDGSHCIANDQDLRVLRSNVGKVTDNTLSRLSDLDNDGEVTKKDYRLMKSQVELSKSLGRKDREDLTCDGKVNSKDVDLLTGLWGESDTTLSWADVTEDGDVDTEDLTIVLGA